MNLTAVYSREINGNVLTLCSSGWTYSYTFVLYDHQTESLWYHLPQVTEEVGELKGLTSIGGEYADKKLEELPSTMTRWNIWKRDNPDTKFLKK